MMIILIVLNVITLLCEGAEDVHTVKDGSEIVNMDVSIVNK